MISKLYGLFGLAPETLKNATLISKFFITFFKFSVNLIFLVEKCCRKGLHDFAQILFNKEGWKRQKRSNNEIILLNMTVARC